MKDPIGDLCRLVKRLSPEARARFINNAAGALGHPGSVATMIPDRETGEMEDVATTITDLEAWIRRTAAVSQLDAKFLVRGLLHDFCDSQRGAATPEHRAAVIDFWLDQIAMAKDLLSVPAVERPGHSTDSELARVISECEDEAGEVERLCDDAQSACDEVEREWALTFSDDYWREWTMDLLRIAMGGSQGEGAAERE